MALEVYLLTEDIQSYIVPESQSSSVCCNNSVNGRAWHDYANKGVHISEPQSQGRLLLLLLLMLTGNRNSAFPLIQVVEAYRMFCSVMQKQL